MSHRSEKKNDEAEYRYGADLAQYPQVQTARVIAQVYNFLYAEDIDGAVNEADLAWTYLPNSIKDKFPSRPSDYINQRVLEDLETPEQMAEQPEFENYSEAALARTYNFRVRVRKGELVKDLASQIVEELDSKGLWSPLGSGFQKTSTKPMKEAPPGKGLPPKLDR